MTERLKWSVTFIFCRVFSAKGFSCDIHADVDHFGMFLLFVPIDLFPSSFSSIISRSTNQFVLLYPHITWPILVYVMLWFKAAFGFRHQNIGEATHVLFKLQLMHWTLSTLSSTERIFANMLLMLRSGRAILSRYAELIPIMHYWQHILYW